MTAVEFLVKELKMRSIDLNKWNGDLVEQAKEMEKQQIIDSWRDGSYEITGYGDGETYYNETFKSE